MDSMEIMDSMDSMGTMDTMLWTVWTLRTMVRAAVSIFASIPWWRLQPAARQYDTLMTH